MKTIIINKKLLNDLMDWSFNVGRNLSDKQDKYYEQGKNDILSQFEEVEVNK